MDFSWEKTIREKLEQGAYPPYSDEHDRYTRDVF